VLDLEDLNEPVDLKMKMSFKLLNDEEGKDIKSYFPI